MLPELNHNSRQGHNVNYLNMLACRIYMYTYRHTVYTYTCARAHSFFCLGVWRTHLWMIFLTLHTLPPHPLGIQSHFIQINSNFWGNGFIKYLKWAVIWDLLLKKWKLHLSRLEFYLELELNNSLILFSNSYLMQLKVGLLNFRAESKLCQTFPLPAKGCFFPLAWMTVSFVTPLFTFYPCVLGF